MAVDSQGLTIAIADFSTSRDSQALRRLMQQYATDPMGGGVPIAATILEALPKQLLSYPGAFSVIAWQGKEPVGLVNCFETLSTFKGKPLVNIHDVIVSPDQRGSGITPQMLARVEAVARQRQCCKLTLEVLEGNLRARSVYQAFGFEGYELDAQFGQAQFWEKPLI